MRHLRPALATLTLVLCSLLTSCSSLAIPDVPTTIASGNWLFYGVFQGTQTAANTFDSFGGSLLQANTQVSGVLHINNACFGNGTTDIPYTGTLLNNALSITSSPVNGQTITLQGTLTQNDTVLGTAGIEVTGGCSGNLYSPPLTYTVNYYLDKKGERIANLTGSWTTTTNISGPSITEQLTQSPTPDVHGDYALTGTVTVTDSPCFTSGTLQSTSYVSGYLGQQTIQMNDGSTLTATMQVNPQSAPNKTSLNLSASTVSGGKCNGPVDIYLQ